MFNFFSLPIYTGTKKEFIYKILNLIKSTEKIYVCVSGAHGIIESFLHPEVRKAHEGASFVVPDGVPLVWLMKLSGQRKAERIYGPDLMLALCEIFEKKGYKIFLYGTTNGTLKKLSENLLSMFPKLKISGVYAPPFRRLSYDEKKYEIKLINKASPDIVFVGLSTPKQELWMHEFRPKLNAQLLIGVGAAFDFIAGIKKQAPVWMRKNGLEWFFRLLQEPRRLLKRYVISNSIFIALSFWYIVSRIMKKIFIVIIGLIILLSVLNVNRINSWPAYVSYGGIYGRVLTYGNYLIYGTSYTKLIILDTRDKTNVKSVDLNIGNTDAQIIYKSSVIAIAGDTVWRIDINKGAEIWRYSTDNHFDIEKIQLAHGYILAGVKDGSLIAIRVNDGSRVWTYETNQPETLSSIESSGRIFHFGEFVIVGQTIYLASRDKNLYALRLKDGKEIWKNNIGDLITTGPDFYGSLIYLMTKSGDSLALSRSDGRVAWKMHENSPGTCADVTLSLWASQNPIKVYIASIAERFRNWVSLGSVAYFEIHENGTVIRRDGKTGKVVWHIDSLGKELNCPTRRFAKMVITSTQGEVYALSATTGTTLWKRNGFGKIFQTPIISARLSTVIPYWLQMILPEKYIFGDENGTLSSIDGSNGDTRWEYVVSSPIYTQPVIYGDMLYVASSDGVLFALNRSTGLPKLSKNTKQFTVTRDTQKISNDEIFEFSISTQGHFDNPWREVEVEAYFIHESGKEIRVRGFYYDKNVWKVRFNPPLKGKWNLSMHWIPYGVRFIKDESFIATTDSSRSYLRIADNYSKRLTVDGKTIFNGLGIGDIMVDYNGNGSYLDDWAMGNSEPIGGARSDRINSLPDFIRIYGPHGAGFNIFRWSLLNATGGLWRDLGFPMVYSIHDGKIGDSFVQALRSNDMHVWLTLFGFGMPYHSTFSPTEKYLLKSYIDYVVARYGAYVDIWELANEAYLAPGVIKFLVDSLHYEDYNQKPISMSFETPSDPSIDIISPHWYESEDVRESDIKMSDHIRVFKQYDKPVIFGEQGFKSINHDDTSAMRMRIKAWTAFFEEGILMFWNQSDKKGIVPDLFPNANIYLGEEERKYTKYLQDFSKDFSLSSRRIGFSINRDDVRVYGLSSEDNMAGYLYHYADWKTPIQTSIKLALKYKAEIQWIDPNTGNIIAKNLCFPGACFLTTPLFSTDIAFRTIQIK